MSEGKVPSLMILRTVLPEEDWRGVEREEIAKAIDDGCLLTNSTAGGEGLDYINAEDKAAYMQNLARAMAAFRETPEGIEQQRRFRAAGMAPEVRARQVLTVKETYNRPGMREKMSAINTEIGNRPEVKDKKSKAAKAMWQNDETRAKLMASYKDPSVKERQSIKRIAAWVDPIVGAKLRELHASPEVRAKKSLAAINRATPEYREMMRKKTTEAWARRKAAAGESLDK